MLHCSVFGNTIKEEMENFAYYVFLVIAAIVAGFVLKKVAGCLMKTIFLAVIVAVLLAIYFLYFKG